MALRGLIPKVSSISGRLRRAPRPLVAAPQATTPLLARFPRRGVVSVIWVISAQI